MPALPVKALSPAKINLFLKITGLRRDGYHNLATLYQMVDLCDTVTFRPDKESIRVTCTDKSIPMGKNLAYLAAKSLWRPGLPGVSIRIEKRIPSGAGLGGGSSNAATTLAVLNRLWGLSLSNSALRKIGKKLGADVPFFLCAPTAWATGIGDRLTELPGANRFYVLLVKPRTKINTASLYRLFDRQLTKKSQMLTNKPRLGRIPARYMRTMILEDIVQQLRNDLGPVVEKHYPVTGRIKRRIEQLGSRGTMVSGSGSAVFGLFKDKRGADKAYREISKSTWWCAVAKTVVSMGHLGAGIK